MTVNGKWSRQCGRCLFPPQALKPFSPNSGNPSDRGDRQRHLSAYDVLTAVRFPTQNDLVRQSARTAVTAGPWNLIDVLNAKKERRWRQNRRTGRRCGRFFQFHSKVRIRGRKGQHELAGRATMLFRHTPAGWRVIHFHESVTVFPQADRAQTESNVRYILPLRVGSKLAPTGTLTPNWSISPNGRFAPTVAVRPAR